MPPEDATRQHASGYPDTAAVITAFRPCADLLEAVRAAARQCVRVVVVDNTPAGESGAEAVLGAAPGVTLLRDGVNRGLAAALNRGVAEASEVDAFLLLDQDSTVPDGLVGRLWAALEQDVRIAIAAPAPWDADAQRFLDPRTRARAEVADMDVVITSGMLLRRSAAGELGDFREDFFVDGVDQDYCLRARRAGWRVVQDRRVLLPHSLGATRWHGVGPLRVRATHHPTWRLYWMARNGVVLVRENLRHRPRWAVTSIALLAYSAAAVAAFEPPRAPRLSAIRAGVRDGMRGDVDARFVPDEKR
ncbi:glycosyltransferase [Cellulomonas sp. P22]|uniref:glycosyltransferase n=1 Tax=Cellulomonas sp. P22 TaxID=3373189 RepID=UPI0037891194